MLLKEIEKIEVGSARLTRGYKLSKENGHQNKKFLYLGTDLNRYSYHLKKEITHGQPKKYPRYKRGAIIEVMFGSNTGYEFSGHHLAIVLNYNDNVKSGMLNVIPLTSKYNKLNVPLGKKIIEAIDNEIKTHLYKLLTNLRTYQNKLELVEEERFLNEEMFDRLIVETSQKEEYELAIKQLILQKNSTSDKIEKLEKVYSDIAKNANQFTKVMKKYKNKDKETYALYDIYTISKLKVRMPINSLDPIGKIKLDKGSMNLINDMIKNRYINL